MSRYHQLLGLRPGAPTDEIKRAYRKKAFEFHPDKNSSPSAHEKFIEITLAYEMLISGKAAYETPIVTNTYKAKKQNTGQPPVNQEEFKAWYSAAKEKAERQSKFRYKEFRKENDAFKKTWYYPFAKVFTLFIIGISAAFTLAIFSIPLWVGFYGKDWFWAGISVFYWLLGIFAYKYTVELKKGYDIHFGH